jgi:hypothetical protein
MWEPCAAFLAASALAMRTGAPSPVWVDVAAFGAIATGALGCVPGEWWAGSIGRAR